MKLTVFPSGKGDCLLLEGDAGGRILVDGGVPASYRLSVSPALGALRAKKKELDLVYVSHIDEDHIGGVLELFDEEVAWRVHEFQRAQGNTAHKPPEHARPPVVRKIWHNAFHEQLDRNSGPVEEALAAMAPVLGASESADLRAIAMAQADLGASIRQAIKVSRRIGPKQLSIPLNPESGGKLMMRRAGQPPIALGSMTLAVLGPSKDDLTRLRKDWNTWLENNAKALKSIREQAQKDEDRLGTGDVSRLAFILAMQARAFGDPSSVTPPNLASLTLLAREGDQAILLTGDARGDQILAGLSATGQLPDEGPLHVNVLKVQHHGSENNIDEAFCDAVTADHYVFCGNGEHENPDLRVVELIASRRLARADGSKFKFWFSSSSTASTNADGARHMTEVEDLVDDLRGSSGGRLRATFLRTGKRLVVVQGV